MANNRIFDSLLKYYREWQGREGAAFVDFDPTEGPFYGHILQFTAAADMPVDITSAANVAGDRIKINGFDPTAKNLRISFHTLETGYTGTTAAAAIAMGVMFCINAADDNDANSRLTYTKVTGAATLSAGRLNTSMASLKCPFECRLGDPLVRLDLIAIPNTVIPTNLIPCFAVVEVG